MRRSEPTRAPGSPSATSTRSTRSTPRLTVERTTAFHDRFLILDGAEDYFVGASVKDAGRKSFAIARIEDAESVAGILARLRA